MKNKTIVLPKRLTIITIDFVLRGAVTENLAPLYDEIEYDFSELGFIDSTGVTVFSNLVEWLLSKGVRQKFAIPVEMSDPVKFLDDSLFFKRYAGVLIDKKSRPRETTIPLKLVKHAASHWWVEKDCIGWLARRLSISEKALIEIKMCLQELFNNIRDHSGVDTGCIFVQHYPKLNKVVISMSDFGAGIPFNVRARSPNLNDGQAVLKALEEGYSTNSTVRNRGVGLYLLTKIVSNNGGEVSIRSGNAHIICSSCGNKDFSEFSGYYAGTLFEIMLRTDRFDSSLADEEEFVW